MAKKIICLVAALVLVVSCFVVPTFAAGYEYNSLDYSKYPSLNAFPFPYPAPGAAVNNKVNVSDPAIHVSRSPEGFSQNTACFILTDWAPGLVVGGKCTFSTEFAPSVSGAVAPSVESGISVRIEVVLSSGEKQYYSCSFFESVTFDTPLGCKVNIYIRFGAYVPFPQFDFYPVLNYGEMAYPYQPYMNYVLDNNYQAGYGKGSEAGYDDGYDDGYVDGLSAADNILSSAFGDVTVDIEFIVNGEAANRVDNVPFARTDNGIYLSSKTQEYLYNNGYGEILENCDNANFVVNFAKPVVYQAVPFYISGNSLVTDVNFYAFDGGGVSRLYTASRTSIDGISDYDVIAIDDGAPVTSPAYIERLSVYCGRPNDLLFEFTLFTLEKGYNNGYLAGYKEGIFQTDNQKYEQGFDDGKKVGFAEGKREGLAVADNGDWLTLFASVIEAPVVAFQSLFNFNIFGFDMRNMATSILTVCVFIVILKKVGAV